MYYYIYDSYLNDKKYEIILHRIENRLMDLGINGKREKLTLLKSLREIVEQGIKSQAETIVVVGNDRTISKVISFLPNYSVILGIIPVGPENKIAKILGIPEGERACDVLSGRIIEKIDLGKVNNNYFLFSLEIPTKQEVVLECENYQITPLANSETISICNLGNIFNGKVDLYKKVYNPRDGVLEAVITPGSDLPRFFGIFKRQYTKESVFFIRKVKIKSVKESISMKADGEVVVKTPAIIEVAPKKLKIIVGKNRMF